MKRVRLVALAGLLAALGCSQSGEPARHAGVNRIFANVRGVT